MIVISAIFNQTSHELAAGKKHRPARNGPWGTWVAALSLWLGGKIISRWKLMVPQFHSLLSREDAKYFFKVIFEDVNDDS